MMTTMTYFMNNIDIISNLLFIARGHAGSRRITPFPTSSQLMTEMCQFRSNILHERSRNSNFSTSPILCSYPPIFYAASAQYLASRVVSISRQKLVMRRPLPILSTIICNRYICGIYDKILQSQISTLIRRRLLNLEYLIERNIYERLGTRRYQSINEGLSNFLWRGYEYEAISKYISALTANVESMNFAICLGFQIWYSHIPSLLLSLGINNLNQILTPEVVNHSISCTREWTSDMIYQSIQVFENLFQTYMQGGSIECCMGESDAESNETVTFDPLGIRDVEVVEHSMHKYQLLKLVTACLTVCMLNAVIYTTVCGSELCHNIPSSIIES